MAGGAAPVFIGHKGIDHGPERVKIYCRGSPFAVFLLLVQHIACIGVRVVNDCILVRLQPQHLHRGLESFFVRVVHAGSRNAQPCDGCASEMLFHRSEDSSHKAGQKHRGIIFLHIYRNFLTYVSAVKHRNAVAMFPDGILYALVTRVEFAVSRHHIERYMAVFLIGDPGHGKALCAAIFLGPKSKIHTRIIKIHSDH